MTLRPVLRAAALLLTLACGGSPDPQHPGGVAGDADADGIADAEDCDPVHAAINPLATDIVGDGIDQNCDGIDGTDMDGDGAAGQTSGGEDCDDGDPARHPQAEEAAGDGLDADCDGHDDPGAADPAAGTCSCTATEVQAALEAGPVDLAAGSTLAGETLLTTGSAVDWTQVDGVPADFADGEDADSLARLSCAEGSLLTFTGGVWACLDPSDLRACPVDTVVAGDACVETSERGVAAWADARNACAAMGRRLCSGQELIGACLDGGLSAATDDAEWVADLYHTAGTTALGASCVQSAVATFTAVQPYRCCLSP